MRKPGLIESILIITIVWLLLLVGVVFMWSGAEYILDKSVEMSKADWIVAVIVSFWCTARIGKGGKNNKSE